MWPKVTPFMLYNGYIKFTEKYYILLIDIMRLMYYTFTEINALASKAGKKKCKQSLIRIGQCQTTGVQHSVMKIRSEMVSEKWLSILNHNTNVHEDHGEQFPKRFT